MERHIVEQDNPSGPNQDQTELGTCANGGEYSGMLWYTVEPPNKGHFGSRAFVLFSEVVLWWEVRVNMQFIAPSRPNIPR